MSDFSIGIKLEVFEEGKLTRTLNGEALDDDTIRLIIEDIAYLLEDEEGEDNAKIHIRCSKHKI